MTIWYSNSTAGHIHKSKSRNSNICTPMFRAPLLRIAKRWKQPEYSLTNEWINRRWEIHTIEHYSVSKRKEILTQDTTWVNLEDIILSEKNSHNMANSVWLHLYEVPREVKYFGTGSKMAAARKWGEWWVPVYEYGLAGGKCWWWWFHSNANALRPLNCMQQQSECQLQVM